MTMKKLLIILLLNFGITGTIFATPFNECKIDIYFGNGIWNKQFSNDNCRKDFAAECSQAELNDLINEEIIKGDPSLAAKYGTVKLAYNWGDGWDIDLVETFYQLKEAGQLSEKTFFALMDELVTKRAADLSGEDLETMRDLLLQAITSHEQSNVDTMIRQYYNESFRYSHRVLLVSHSQGNLFANRVYDSLNPAGYKDYFANVQVASPASSVHAAKGTYITGRIDPIINPIPGSMEYNAKLDGLGGHQFVAAYLDSNDTYQKIVQAIKDKLAALDDPSQTPSQWKIVKEPEDRSSCEAIRVEMAHRFDDSLGPVEDVYPFETDATIYKLYPAADEAVEKRSKKIGKIKKRMSVISSILWKTLSRREISSITYRWADPGLRSTRRYSICGPTVPKGTDTASGMSSGKDPARGTTVMPTPNGPERNMRGFSTT